MPPRKYKTDHRRGGGGGKGEEAIMQRNAEGGGDKAAESGSDAEPEKPAAKPAKESSKDPSQKEFVVKNPNAERRDEEADGVEMTRKRREELQAQAAKKRYEELHKAGKTDEAKADLSRLEEVKKRRAEVAQKKEEDAAKAKADAEDAKYNPRAGMQAELKNALGGESAKMPGSRSKKSDKKEGDSKGGKLMNGTSEASVYSDFITKESVAAAPKMKKPVDGSIHSCRAAEEDFM